MFIQRRGMGRLRGRRLGLVSTLVNGSLIYGSPVNTQTLKRPVAIGPARIINPIQIGPQKTYGGSSPSSAASPYTIPTGDAYSLSTLWSMYRSGNTLTKYQLNRLQAAGYAVGSGISAPSGSPWQGGGPSGWNGGGGGGWGGGGGYGGGGYGGANNPNSQNNLAQLTQLYYSNPSQLSQQQWEQLQAAGVIPGTSPYSNAALTNSPSSSGIDPATGVPYSTELAEAEASSSTVATASPSLGTELTTSYSGLPLYVWLLIGGGTLYVLMGKRR